jgi:hypothetical protein
MPWGLLHTIIVPVYRVGDLMASWQILVHADVMAALYSPGSGFEGSAASACAWSQPVCQFDGLADGGARAVQDSAWWRSIRTEPHNTRDGSIAPGMGPQRPGWPHRIGEDGGLCFTRLASLRRPGWAPGWWSYVPRGHRCPLSRGAEWRKDGKQVA